MFLFEKLTSFRRLVGSVPYLRSSKSFCYRLSTRVSPFNNDSDFCFINLDKKLLNPDCKLCLLDVIEVPSSCLEQDIIINVYACIIYNDINPHIYYKVNV